MQTMWILEQQRGELYDPQSVMRIWGVYSDPAYAQATFAEYVRDLGVESIDWKEDTRGFMGEGKRVISTSVPIQAFSATSTYHMHLVPMTLDFDVPSAAMPRAYCPACGELIQGDDPIVW